MPPPCDPKLRTKLVIQKKTPSSHRFQISENDKDTTPARKFKYLMIYNSLSDVTPGCYWRTIRNHQEQNYHDGLKRKD